MSTGRRNTVRKLMTGSPRLSRAGSRYPLSLKSEGKSQDALLETSSMFGGVDPQGNRNIKMENTYKMKPDAPFKTKTVEDSVSDVMNDFLNDVTYDYQEIKLLSQQLSNKILECVKKMGFSRYKFIVSVNIGSLKEQAGIQFGSRCLWNSDTDSFVTVRYTNKSLFAVALIYGLYFE